jgi:hypothetical protein
MWRVLYEVRTELGCYLNGFISIRQVRYLLNTREGCTAVRNKRTNKELIQNNLINTSGSGMFVCRRDCWKNNSQENCHSVWRCRRVSCHCRHRAMTWERLRKTTMGPLTSNAGGVTKTRKRDVGGASSGLHSCRGSGQPNGFSSGCAGRGPCKVRDIRNGNFDKQTNKLHVPSPRANYTDRATADCRRKVVAKFCG